MNFLKIGATNYHLLILLELILLAGCKPKGSDKTSTQSYSQPVTKLAISLRPDTAGVDTAAIANEIQSLVHLTDEGSREIEYKVEPKLADNLLTLKISPKIGSDTRENIHQILDTLAKHPSSLPSVATVLKVTEERQKVLDLLEIKSGATYPLRPASYQVEWAYEQKDSPDYNRYINSSYVITYLRYGLIKPLPSLSYTFRAGKNAGKLGKAANKIYSALGPSTADYEISSTSPQLQEHWDSLRSQYEPQFYENQMQLRWKTISFKSEPFRPFIHTDTLIQTSIDKLTTTKPYLFHILIAPALSRNIADFRFIKATK